MKKTSMNLVIGIGAVTALAAAAYALLNQQGRTAPVDTSVPASTRPGAFDSYIRQEVDYTGGLLPWLQKQLNPLPTPNFGVNASPYYGSTPPAANPTFGVHAGYGIVAPDVTAQPWTTAGSSSSAAGSSSGVTFGTHYY